MRFPTAARRNELGILARAGTHRYSTRLTGALSSARRSTSVRRVPSTADLHKSLVRAAAEELGVEVRPLPGDFLELRYGDRRSLVEGSHFELERLIPWLACGDKQLTSTILSEQGLPVPRYGSFSASRYAEALERFREAQKPVVVKPTRGTSAGLGVTLNVFAEDELRSAFARARAHSSEVMIEEQIDGENLRVTVLHEEVLGAVRRIPAHVVGDGTASVKALVSAKNRRWEAGAPDNRLFRPIALDGESRRVLALQRLDFDSVPPAGARVKLREISNAHEGSEVEDVESSVHEDYLALSTAAGRAMGAALVGVDLIVRDLRAPAGQDGVVINEVNTTPALYLVNAMADGAPSIRATERVLRSLFDIP